MTDDDRTVQAIAARIAEAGGFGWTHRDPGDTPWLAYIDTDDDVTITIQRDGQRGKLRIGADLPKVPYGARFEYPSIGCSADKDPARIVADIRRRLIPQAIEQRDLRLAWLAEQGRRGRSIRETADRLIAACPGLTETRANGGSDRIELRLHEPWLDIEVGYTETTCRIEGRAVPNGLVERIVEAVAAWSAQRRGAAA